MPFLELDVLNNAPEPILGIDLGTTNSMVAIFRGGRHEVLHPKGSDDGRIPSVVHFPSDGSAPLVGRSARDHAVEAPHTCLFSVKRFMGRGLADLDTSDLPFPVAESEHGLVRITAGGREWTPQELSALILNEARRVAGEALDSTPPSRAVITVPAYFDDAQRQATRDAARLAGIEVMRIINEPTAASLAYGLDQRNEGTIVVYDLGGGTFDVSILSIEEGVFRVLATAGDTHLGGDDLDRAIVQAMLAELGDLVDDETRGDSAFLQGLRLAAERCKIELSRHPEAEFAVIAPEHGLNWRHRLTRERFEELIAPFLERTFDACRRALADAKLTPDEIEEVVLVGGSTRVPVVRKRVEEFFGRKPHTELNPDEVVALGAAVQGHVLMGGTRDILLLDVTPLSLGIETMGGAVSKIIDRNAPIPTQATEGFTTYAENQTGIDFHIVQGERELADDCRSLGRFKLTGIPPMPAGLPRVAVRFSLDADGILTVTAKEESTGQQASIEVQPMHGLSDGEVDTMLQESFAHAREDFDQSRLANLKVELGTMLQGVHANLPTVSDRLDPETLADLNEAIAAAEAARENGSDVAQVQKTRDDFERATLPLAALLMDAVAKKALAGKNLNEV